MIHFHIADRLAQVLVRFTVRGPLNEKTNKHLHKYISNQTYHTLRAWGIPQHRHTPVQKHTHT